MHVSLSGQAKIESQQSAEFYVKNVLLGEGVEVKNIKHYGWIGGLGQFEADSAIIGVKSGIVLSTGKVDSIFTENKISAFTSYGQLPVKYDKNISFRKGDKDLNTLCKKKTTDISIIEFDFVPQKNTIEFNYVFGSDEYLEFVGSNYNDVFGFFVSGPGIKKKINLATLPDEKTPISINTVNHKVNSGFFRRNYHSFNFITKIIWSDKKKKGYQKLHDYIQFDGLTIVLKAKCDVIPFRTYHIKIAIGDVSDAAMDSGVFLEAGSFCSIKDTSGKFHKELVKIENGSGTADSIVFTTFTDTLPDAEIDPAFEFTDIHFAFDSYELTDSSKIKLDALAVYLEQNKKLNCLIYGFTDNKGSKKYNQELSEKRAGAVKKYLEEKKIETGRISYYGMNYEKPKFTNSTEKGRALNRRVELVLEEN